MWGDILKYSWTVSSDNENNTTSVTQTPETAKVANEKKTVEDNIKTKSIEQTQKLNKEVQSKTYLEKSKLNFEKSVKLVADILWVKNKYDKSFVEKLEEKQKKLWLKPDWILWDKSLWMILAWNQDKIDISLTDDNEIKNFYKAIKEWTVNKKILESISSRLSNFLADKPSRANDWRIYSDSFFWKNMTNNLIARKLFQDFKKTEQWKKEEFSDIYKEVEKKEIEQTTKLVKNTVNILNLDPKVKAAFQKATWNNNLNSTSWTTFSPDSWEWKIWAVANDLKKNPLLMAWALIGFIMFIFWKRDWFAKAWFFGLLAVLWWPWLIKTAKNIAWHLWIEIPDVKTDPAKVAETEKYIWELSDKTQEKAKSMWGTVLAFKDNLVKKSEGIVEKVISDNNKFTEKQKENVGIISWTLTNDDTFKKLDYSKLDSTLEINKNNFDEKTLKLFNEKWISSDSPEFKAYITALHWEIAEAKKEDDKIKTVWDYFDNYKITADQVSVGVGAGLMAWGLISKSPTKFFLWASAVWAGLYWAWENFFGSETWKTIIRKAESITKKYWGKISANLDYLELEEKDKTYILKLLELKWWPDFKALKEKYKKEDKILKFISSAEKDYYTAEVEAKTWENSYLTWAIDFFKEKQDDYTDSYNEHKTEITGAISSLEKLRDNIPNTVSNRQELVDKIDLEIIDIKDKLELVKINQNTAKIEKVKDLEKQKVTLLKEKEDINKKFSKIPSPTEKEVILHRQELRKVDKELIKINAQLTSAKTEKTKVLANNFDEVAKKTKLTQLTTDLKTQIAKPKLNPDEIKEIIDNYNNLKKEAEDAGNTSLNSKFGDFETVKKELAEKIKEQSTDILGALDEILAETKKLSEYKNLKIDEQSKLLEIVLGSSEDFEEKVKGAEIKIFEDRIKRNNLTFKELSILNKNFSTIKGVAKYIESKTVLELVKDENFKKILIPIDTLTDKYKNSKLDDILLKKIKLGAPLITVITSLNSYLKYSDDKLKTQLWIKKENLEEFKKDLSKSLEEYKKNIENI